MVSPLCVKWVLIHIPQVFWCLVGKEGKPEARGNNQYCSPYIQHSEKQVSVSLSLGSGRDLLWVSLLWFHPGIQNYHLILLKKICIPELLIKSNCSGMSVTWLSESIFFLKLNLYSRKEKEIIPVRILQWMDGKGLYSEKKIKMHVMVFVYLLFLKFEMLTTEKINNGIWSQ